VDVDVKTFLIDFKSRLKGAKDAIATMQKLDAVIATTGKDAQKSFGRINDASSILSTKTNIIGSRGGKQLTQMTQVVQNTAGEFKKLTYQQENVKGKMVLVKDSVKVANVATKDFNKSTMSLGDNFKKLAGRAALTIPIWLALRTVVMGLFRTIGDGLKYWVEIDKEMMRVSMTMGDVSGKGDVLESVFEKANKMSKETGKSMNEIIKSFYQFKTLGLSVTDSMAGMNAVTKGSIALMANLDSLALALSQSYKILGGTMDKNIDTEGLMEANLGKILLLFHENAFVTDELTGAVNRFLPTAATMNFTFDETIALMATLHSSNKKYSCW